MLQARPHPSGLARVTLTPRAVPGVASKCFALLPSPKFPRIKIMNRLDSVKRSEKIAQKKFKTRGSAYETVVKRVEQAFHDIAKKSGKTLAAAELKELMYGEKGLIKEAHEYAKVHAGK